MILAVDPRQRLVRPAGHGPGHGPGRRLLRGRERIVAAAGLAARAVILGLIGLLLGYPTTAAGLQVYVILAYYAVMFVLAIPLIGLPPRVLFLAALGLALVGPLAVFALDPSAVPVPVDSTGGIDPRLGDLLHHLDGLDHLRRAAPGGGPWTDTQLLWDPPVIDSWWALVERAPHSTTPFDMLHTLGSAMAVLGASLVLTRLPVIRGALRPLAAAGSMILTLYVGHVLVLCTGVLDEDQALQFGALLGGAILVAAVWRRTVGRGPLESLLAMASAAARRAAGRRRPDPERVAPPGR